MAETKTNIWDLDLEVKALKTVLGESPYASKLYGFLKAEHFHFKVTKLLFNRLQEVMLTLDTFPTWQMLVTDSKLESGVQSALQDQFEKSAKVSNGGDYAYLCSNLQELANKRAIYAKIYEGQEGLYDPEKSARDIAGELSSAIIDISDDDADDEMGLGADYNEFAEATFQDAIQGRTAQNVLPSCYNAFDTRNFGFLPGDLVLLGASTGGGKSTMALNMLTRQYLRGKNTVMASYEMSYNQLHGRHLSLLSEVPHDRIRSNSMSVQERLNVECAWREFNLFGRKNGNRFWISCPTKDETVMEVGMKYADKKPHIYIFDYINFLKRGGKKKLESQWQELGEISREGKILARRRQCVVVMLMQIDKEHQVRYAKAIQDHADWAWGWVFDEEAKMNGFVNVKQLKARSGNPFDFQLCTRFDICQFRDPEDDDKNLKYTEADRQALMQESRQLGLIPGGVQQAKPVEEPKQLPPPPDDEPVATQLGFSRVTPAKSYL